MEEQGEVLERQDNPALEPDKLDHLSFGDQFGLRLDAKGRIILPSIFRAAFARGGRLRPYEPGCLGLWTEQAFKLFDARLYDRRHRTLSGKGPRRGLFASAAFVLPDSQGRFVIPERLRRAVSLTYDVTVVGNIDHLEIWPSHAWEVVARDDEEMLAMEIATDDGPRPDQLR